MKNENISKINKFGKAGYIICKICMIAITVSAVACLAGGILLCFVPRDAVQIKLTTSNTATVSIGDEGDISNFLELDTAQGTLSLGEHTYSIVEDGKVDPETVTSTVYVSDFKWICFAGTVVCVALYFVLYFAKKLCRYFKDCETPFTEDISKQLTCLAWSLIPACILNSFMESFANSAVVGKTDLSISIDLVTVLLVLCIFMLSFVFKHGALLQAESDELL